LEVEPEDVIGFHFKKLGSPGVIVMQVVVIKVEGRAGFSR
jgi:hypothetical protein